MKRQQAFKYELRPNGEQARLMRRFAGAARFVFNRALALQQARYADGDAHLSYPELCRELTAWRHADATAWLSEAPSQALPQKLKDLCRAYANFFTNRTEFPKFKRKWRQDRFRYPEGRQIKLDQTDHRIFLPKLGWMQYRHSRAVLGDIKNVTISQSCGKWYAPFRPNARSRRPSPRATWLASTWVLSSSLRFPTAPPTHL